MRRSPACAPALPPEVLLVLDAAYAEYVERPDYDPGMRLVDATDNTVMTRTFSKIFGLGGMRIGWAYGPPAVIDVLNRVRGPFNVSIAAQAAAIAALAEPGWVEKGRAHNARIPPEAGRRARRGGHQGLAQRGQFRAGRLRRRRSVRRRRTHTCADVASSCARSAATACRTACASPSATPRRSVWWSTP